MKRVITFGSAAVLLCAATSFSQQPPAAGQKVGLATSLQRSYAGIKAKLHRRRREDAGGRLQLQAGLDARSADVRPVIAHIAQSQFGQCSALKGVPNPMAGKQLEQELKTKAEVTKALADSFALCDDLFSSVTDANATEMVKQGQNEVTRAASLYGVIVHDNEIAGTAYAYLRSKNIVPPSTERAKQGMRGRGGLRDGSFELGEKKIREKEKR